MPFGRMPTWKPKSFSDRLIVFLLTFLYLAFYFPMIFIERLLGRTKINWLLLDIMSIPGKLVLVISSLFGKRSRSWGLKFNAFVHIYFLCRMCPVSRQATRDPKGTGLCRWNRRWNDGDFSIVPDFGTLNYVKQFAGRVDLKNYNNLIKEKDR